MRNKFKLMVHESNGQQYQDLFSKIMSYASPSFKAVKAHGNIGDRGNDGWCAAQGKYFQVYAPEELADNTKAAIKKMKVDFDKLLSYWESISPVKEYVFVVNDKFKGVPPHLIKAVSDIKIKHNLSDASIFSASDLENILFSLGQDQIESILGSMEKLNADLEIYKHLILSITTMMYLRYWRFTSENLIANSIEDEVLSGFERARLEIYTTVLPKSIPSLDDSIIELAENIHHLTCHFTDSECAYLTDDSIWWRRDMRWKRDRIYSNEQYRKKYEIYDKWRENLYIHHCNLVHSLNLFSAKVRDHIDPLFFMGKQFSVVDSMGTFNALEGYELIPSGYRELK